MQHGTYCNLVLSCAWCGFQFVLIQCVVQVFMCGYSTYYLQTRASTAIPYGFRAVPC